MARKPKKSALAKTVVKKEIIEIESDTDTYEVGGRMLALCGAENESGDYVLAKNSKKSALDKIVKKEITVIESDTDTDIDEVGGRMLAICGEMNAPGNGALVKYGKTNRTNILAKKPKKSVVAKTIVKKEITEIESDTETDIDEIGGRMLALCDGVNASWNGALDKYGKTNKTNILAKNPKKSVVAKTIVQKEITEIESDTDTDIDEIGGKMLALCGEENASGNGALVKYGKTNRTNMQIVCADDRDYGLVYDSDFKKYLAHFSEIGDPYLLEDNMRGSSPMCIMYNVDHEASDRSKGKAAKMERSRAGRKPKSPTISSVRKRLKNKNGRADHNSISRTVMTKETHQNKGDARRGRKSSVAKNSIKLKPTSYVRDTKQKNGDARRGRKISVAKNTIELKPQRYVRGSQEKNGGVRHGRKISLAKKDTKLKHTRNDKSQLILRASKRLKTEIGRSDHSWISKSIPVVNTKDTQQRKQEALQRRKIPVTELESKSINHVTDNLSHSFKLHKKENENSLSSMDTSYSYYVGTVRNSITIFKPDRQVKHVKDVAQSSDPDIIAVSDHPFLDGCTSPFDATKGGKVIDLEDATESDDIFNSSYSKKLIKILRNPYDEKEFLRLDNEASLKRPLTRSRQLRDGREIEYNVEDKLALSYLEYYTDFNKKYRRYRKDLPKALNLLRGLFFYLKNIAHKDSYPPWMYEKRLTNLCVNAREC